MNLEELIAQKIVIKALVKLLITIDSAALKETVQELVDSVENPKLHAAILEKALELIEK